MKFGIIKERKDPPDRRVVFSPLELLEVIKLFPNAEIKVESIFKGPPAGKPVNVEIRGNDFDVMRKIAEEYQEYLKTLDGVRDIRIDLEPGKTEYNYSVNEKMAAWAGVSAYDIASTLNASFMGAVSTKVNQNEEEIGVRVRFQEKSREKMSGLKDVKIANMTGGLVSLDAVSNVKMDKSFSQINRLNYRRLVQVQAEVDLSKTTPIAVVTKLRDKFSDFESDLFIISTPYEKLYVTLKFNDLDTTFNVINKKGYKSSGM
jgi:multidrug efflux pump subunit AcrB